MVASAHLLGLTLNPATAIVDALEALGRVWAAGLAAEAGRVVAALLSVITTTSDPVFSGGWWTGSGAAVFSRVVEVAGSLLALSFVLSIITAMLSADARVLRKALLHLPLAVIQTGLLVTVVAALISATDELSTFIAAGDSTDLTVALGTTLIVAITDAGFVGIVLAPLIIVGVLAVWAQLIVRTALLYITVMGAPLVFAASVHPSVRGIQKRYAEFGVGLICAKVVVALAFATGTAELGGIGSSPSFTAAVGALLEAFAILVIAAFAPWLFVRLLIGVEALVIAEGLERRPLRTAQHAQQAAYYVCNLGLLRGIGINPPGGGNRGGGNRGGGNQRGGGSGGSGNGGSPSRPGGGGPSPSSPSTGTGRGGSTPAQRRTSTSPSGASTASSRIPPGLAEARAALEASTGHAPSDRSEQP